MDSSQPKVDRRRFLVGGVIGAVVAAMADPMPWGRGNAATRYAVTFTEAEWRKRLSPQAFMVLRGKSTERPFTSPLLNEHRKGSFVCAGCALPLFASTTKFDSGTGWPSFWQPLKGGIGTSTDYELGYPRTEVHCARCGGHLGHVFDDGPPPTGKRYCMNGVALKFVPA